MKDGVKKLAASIIYIDGEVASSEIKGLANYAAPFGIDANEFVSSVEAEIEKLKPLDEEELNNYVQEAAKSITEPEHRYKVFDMLLQLSIADGTLDDLETSLLGNISQSLEIPNYYFANNLAYYVKEKGVQLFAQKGYVKPEELKNN